MVSREGSHFKDINRSIAIIRDDKSSFFECLEPNTKLLDTFGLLGPYKEGDVSFHPMDAIKVPSAPGQYYIQEFRESKALRTILRHFIKFRVGFGETVYRDSMIYEMVEFLKRL